MNTIIITDVNDMELGVFILFKYREEIKKVIPGISHSIAKRSLTDLVSSFSLFTLHELIRSILSGLKALCSRNILFEEQQPQRGANDTSSFLQRNSSNFNTRQRMEEIVINYAPLLSKKVRMTSFIC